MLFTPKKRSFKKVRKMELFLSGYSMVFVKKSNVFSLVFFWGKLSEKRLFFDILDGKECFLHQKIEIFKKSEKSKFSKGVSPCFFYKNLNIFSWLLFGQINLEKFVFLMFWVERNAVYTRKAKF